MKCISYCDARERIDPLLPHSALSGYNSWSSRDQTAVESEPLKWKNCLQDLLRHQHGQEAFAKFLKSEYSGENLTFWLHIISIVLFTSASAPTFVPVSKNVSREGNLRNAANWTRIIS